MKRLTILCAEHKLQEAESGAWIRADWPAPPWICAGTTTRQGGASLPPYACLNLSDRVGDVAETVAANRSYLIERLRLPSLPKWPRQIHGATVIESGGRQSPQADGTYTSSKGPVCTVLTADCLPILLCNRAGTEVAALHAGWRGLAQGIIASGLARMTAPADQILVWLGPAIGAKHYEVDVRVRNAIMTRLTGCSTAFVPTRPGHWSADLFTIARRALSEHGVYQIYGGQHCTYSEVASFFSHRRDGPTGRMASLIWMEPTSR